MNDVGRRSWPLVASLAAGLAIGPALGQGPPPASGGEIATTDVMNLKTVTIGVREDTRPFAWRDLRPEHDGGEAPKHEIFRGFLVDLCVKAAIHAGYRPKLVPVTAEARRKFLDERDPYERDDAGDEAIDVPRFHVLCDPTTISLSRMYRLGDDEEFVFSPIVYVANSSFVEVDQYALKKAKEEGKWPAAEEAAADESAVAGSLPETCIPGSKPNGASVKAGFVTGTTAKAALEAAIDLGSLGRVKEYCPYAFKSHRDGMEAVCSGSIRYYFGDLDIISEYEKEISAVPKKSCKIKYTREFLIYEPYAILVGAGDDGFRPKFMRELYRLFSDGTVERAFTANFPDRRASSALSMLFQINGIPMGTLPSPEASGPAVDKPEARPAIDETNPRDGQQGAGHDTVLTAAP